jgi:predicted 3-demethylubiquinone-9 3-methyltransferase (glyoxalase superfamily)
MQEQAMSRHSTPPKATVCLWYDHDAEAAARFYAATFPDSHVRGGVPRVQGEGA